MTLKWIILRTRWETTPYGHRFSRFDAYTCCQAGLVSIQVSLLGAYTATVLPLPSEHGTQKTVRATC